MPDSSKFRSTRILSVIIAVLAAAASAGGLFIPGLYRDNALVTSAFRGNDVVTLVIGVPLLIGAMVLSIRGSKRAQLVWMGTLAFMLYNYVFYLYGAAFNRMFLAYVALVTLSIYALALGMSALDMAEIARSFRPKTPVRLIGGWMIFFALFLGGLWIARSVGYIVSSVVPQDIIQTGHPTGVVYATDLTLLIPGLMVGAIWLIGRRPWGYVLSAVMMVKCMTYPLALIAMSAFAERATGSGDPLLPLWLFLWAGTLVSAVVLLGNMKTQGKHELH